MVERLQVSVGKHIVFCYDGNPCWVIPKGIFTHIEVIRNFPPGIFIKLPFFGYIKGAGWTCPNTTPIPNETRVWLPNFVRFDIDDFYHRTSITSRKKVLSYVPEVAKAVTVNRKTNEFYYKVLVNGVAIISSIEVLK